MKEYKNKDLVVHWYPEQCAHPGTCLRLLPQVFCLDARPWVNVDAAPPEEIMRCVDQCPSGALRYSLPEGSRVDPALAHGPGALDCMKSGKGTVRVKVIKNGPYLIEGGADVVCADGTPIYSGERIALCSCGCTLNPPFCDGAHRNGHK